MFFLYPVFVVFSINLHISEPGRMFTEDLVLTGPLVVADGKRADYVCRIPVKQIEEHPVIFVSAGKTACSVFPDCNVRGAMYGYECKCVNSTDTASYYVMSIKNLNDDDGLLVHCSFHGERSNKLWAMVYRTQRYFTDDLELTGPTTIHDNELTEFVCRLPVKQIKERPVTFFVHTAAACAVFPNCTRVAHMNTYQCKCVNSTASASFFLMTVKNPKEMCGPLVYCVFKGQLSNVIEVQGVKLKDPEMQ